MAGNKQKKKSVTDWLKSQDAFGEPVRINYKGEKEYSTNLGATFTILL